jgi:hypothetical protein
MLMNASVQRAWTYRAATVFTTSLLAFASTTPVTAAVVELQRQDFDSAMVGRNAFVDDFESYLPGAQGVPFKLSNGVTFDNTAPSIEQLGFTGQFLRSGTVFTEARRFLGFSADATLIAFDLALDEDDEFDVTVLTTSGSSLVIEARRGDKFEGFFAVQVTGGDHFASIAFASAGGSTGAGGAGSSIANYGFDNFTVDAVTAVPLPPAFALLLAPLTALSARMRRRLR